MGLIIMGIVLMAFIVFEGELMVFLVLMIWGEGRIRFVSGVFYMSMVSIMYWEV